MSDVPEPNSWALGILEEEKETEDNTEQFEERKLTAIEERKADGSEERKIPAGVPNARR